MPTTILYCVESETPCCHAPVRLMAHGHKDEYFRRCARCGGKWRIERAGRVIESGFLAGANADVLGWNKA